MQRVLADLRHGPAPAGRGYRGARGRGRRLLPARATSRSTRSSELVRELLSDLPLDPGSWRLDTTVHPFATAIATTDVRLTTRYDEALRRRGAVRALHEAGHGLYEDGDRSGAAPHSAVRPASLGLHESQSRTWENWVGRGRPYCPGSTRRLRDAFPDQLEAIDAEDLYRAANRVEPSLIRMEADELTYNLHIVAALRARARDLRGPPGAFGPAGGVERARPGVPRDRSPRRRPRRSPGRPLGGGVVRLLPHLLARQRDRGTALGASASDALPDLERSARPRRAAAAARVAARAPCYRHGAQAHAAPRWSSA